MNKFGILAILLFVFYLGVCIVPRAIGRADIPKKIEKLFIPEAKPSIVWFAGHHPSDEK